jgi:hypothetical protein
MFDYYRFRFSIFKGWRPEFGYELMAPAGIFGVVMIIFILYLTSPQFGLLMWRAPLPHAGKLAIGLVLVLLLATYAADELKRPGLWVVAGVCVIGLIATAAVTIDLARHHASRLYYSGMEEPTSAYLIGAPFAVYLLIMLGLTVTRLRGAYSLE